MEPVVKSDVQLLIEHDRFESTFQFNFNDNVDVRVFCMGPIRFIGEMAYLGKYEQFKEEIDACVDALFRLFTYHEAVKEMPNDFRVDLRCDGLILVLNYLYLTMDCLRDAALRDGVIADKTELRLPMLSVVEHVFEEPLDGWYLTTPPFSFIEQACAHMDAFESSVNEGATHVWVKALRGDIDGPTCNGWLQVRASDIESLVTCSEVVLEASVKALQGEEIGDPIMRALVKVVNADECDAEGKVCSIRGYDILSLIVRAREIDANDYAGQVYLNAIARLIKALRKTY